MFLQPPSVGALTNVAVTLNLISEYMKLIYRMNISGIGHELFLFLPFLG